MGLLLIQLGKDCQYRFRFAWPTALPVRRREQRIHGWVLWIEPSPDFQMFDRRLQASIQKVGMAEPNLRARVIGSRSDRLFQRVPRLCKFGLTRACSGADQRFP